MSQTTMQTCDSRCMHEQVQRPTLPAIVPCALVYLDYAAAASPNCRSADPSTYIRQAACLNRSLLAAGMPRLNVYTNAPDAVAAEWAALPDAAARPAVHLLTTTRSDLPKNTPFYAAHFKLDLMMQVAQTLPPDALFLLLDTDMVAMRGLDAALVARSARLGAGVFDISDQVFPAYGSERVIADLERVAGGPLVNPRWYGGEFLLCTQAFLALLVEQGRACFGRYLAAVRHLHHHGDEAFISAALCLLAQAGHAFVEVGAYQAVGRHWPGNTHRNLYWFSRCAFVHLPGSKSLIEREARRDKFDPACVWRALVWRHRLGRARAALKPFVRMATLPAWRRLLAPARRTGETKLEAAKRDISGNA
ncbi:hypothetical protein WKR88_11625 [Trinickia caryophylli]|nr:hypothetical protein [Trinickia caryophylli]WQE15300.1 hypothetical protein U0034_22435 [Trinickia caryophylli]